MEAARAGEHGKGFAVVAEEVRNSPSGRRLPQGHRELIEASIEQANKGGQVVERAAEGVRKVARSSRKIAENVGAIAVASNEQSRASTRSTMRRADGQGHATGRLERRGIRIGQRGTLAPVAADAMSSR